MGKYGEKEKLKLSSHSCRHGSVDVCLSNIQVPFHWLVHRGGWTLDRAATAFEYFNGLKPQDRSVARIIAGWPETDKGGLLPTFLDLNNDYLYEKFKLIAKLIFYNLSDDQKEIRDNLLIIQIIHFEEIFENNQNHLLIFKINKVCQATGIAVEVIKSSSKILKAAFLLLNIAAIHADSVPRSLLQELDNIKMINQQYLIESNRIKKEVVELSREIKENIKIDIDLIKTELVLTVKEEFDKIKDELSSIRHLISNLYNIDTNTSDNTNPPNTTDNNIHVLVNTNYRTDVLNSDAGNQAGISNINSYPILLHDLKNITIFQIIYMAIQDKIHLSTVTRGDLSEKKYLAIKKQQNSINDLIRIISSLNAEFKTLLQSETFILNASNVNEYVNHNSIIKKRAKVIEDFILELLNDNRPTNIRGTKRVRKIENKCQGVHKRLKDLVKKVIVFNIQI